MSSHRTESMTSTYFTIIGISFMWLKRGGRGPKGFTIYNSVWTGLWRVRWWGSIRMTYSMLATAPSGIVAKIYIEWSYVADFIVIVIIIETPTLERTMCSEKLSECDGCVDKNCRNVRVLRKWQFFREKNSSAKVIRAYVWRVRKRQNLIWREDFWLRTLWFSRNEIESLAGVSNSYENYLNTLLTLRLPYIVVLHHFANIWKSCFYRINCWDFVFIYLYVDMKWPLHMAPSELFVYKKNWELQHLKACNQCTVSNQRAYQASPPPPPSPSNSAIHSILNRTD